MGAGESVPDDRSTSAGTASTPRVLSIQSHVVSGYVGNKCAVLPLQILGFHVDPVNSVQFSNHTGYPAFRSGGIPPLAGPQLADILDGLRTNGLLSGYSHLLTGYIGSVSLLDQAISIANELRQAHADLDAPPNTLGQPENRPGASPSNTPFLVPVPAR